VPSDFDSAVCVLADDREEYALARLTIALTENSCKPSSTANNVHVDLRMLRLPFFKFVDEGISSLPREEEKTGCRQPK